MPVPEQKAEESVGKQAKPEEQVHLWDALSKITSTITDQVDTNAV